MVFSSTVFLFIFLPVALAVYYNPFFKGRTFKNVVLTLFSLGFYGWGEPVFIFVMLISIVINWIFGLLLDKYSDNHSKKKFYLVLSVVYNLALIFVFKYLTFVTKNIAILVNNNDVIINIALPIGISFFTFQMMSYIFDVYYGNAKVQRNLLHVVLYVSMFPQLIAGPIVRYQTVADEIMNRKESSDDFAEGFLRFIVGLAKKILISNYVGKIADIAFSSSDLSVCMAWLGAIAYTLQIYFDFSGYSDMAIGLGRMFGFHFLENFNYPYVSSTITEFWRRWHMTLGTWFRDYVYIPLGGNRCSKGRWIFNTFMVWFLTGVWHGANWTFIVWGLMYFVLLIFEKSTGLAKKKGWYMHAYTMLFVVLGWIIVRAESLTTAIKYIGCMFGIGAKGFMSGLFTESLANSWVIFIAAIIFSFPVVGAVREKLVTAGKENLCAVLKSVILLILFVISVVVCVKATYNPFIYLNF